MPVQQLGTYKGEQANVCIFWVIYNLLELQNKDGFMEKIPRPNNKYFREF